MWEKLVPETTDEIKSFYGVEDDNSILRILKLQDKIKKEKQRVMSICELMEFLKSSMNYDNMQIWLMGKSIEGVELNLDDKLKKFFELKSDEEILRLYDVEQNYNQHNIKNILYDDIEDDSTLHLGLIEEDEDDMEYKGPTKTLKRIVPCTDDIED